LKAVHGTNLSCMRVVWLLVILPKSYSPKQSVLCQGPEGTNGFKCPDQPCLGSPGWTLDLACYTVLPEARWAVVGPVGVVTLLSLLVSWCCGTAPCW